MRAFPPLNEQMDAIRRGAVEIVPEEALVRKLERAIATGVPLTVKQGFDPTRPHLHLGYMVSIRKLRTFQDLGHTVVFLIGDFTALVGDPSGRSETRPPLTEQEVRANAATYQDQVFRVLDPKRTQIRRNSEWHGKLSLADGLAKLAAHYTVARLAERDDFAKRLASGTPITMMEFFYPLLQGYDSVALKADVELGGTDQKFNLLVGRTLMERHGLEPQVALVMPLLRGTDGERKMSQSYDNYVGITEAPEDQYGKTMSIPDTLLEEWTTLLSTVGAGDLAAALARCRAEPYAAKRALARDVVSQFHGPEAAARAEAHFDRLFKDKQSPAEMPTFAYSPGSSLAQVAKEIGFAQSTSEARRMASQGGVQLDDVKVEDANVPLTGKHKLKYGKLKFALLEPRST